MSSYTNTTPIATNICSNHYLYNLPITINPIHGEVYLIQHYVIKFVSKLRQVDVFFLSDTPVSPTNKTDCHDITEILLKMGLNTINLNQTKIDDFKSIQYRFYT